MTIYCYDTEFLEDGNTIELISIGIVGPDDREYYAVNADCDFDRVREHDWLWENVVPHLPTTKTNWDQPQHGRLITSLDRSAACVKPKWVIANEVRDFIVGDITPCGEHNGVPAYFDTDLPELWAYFGAYDHVALAQLFGPMSELPDLMPMWTHDLMQLIEPLKELKLPEKSDEHNALADAKWNALLLAAANQHIAKAL